MSPIDCHFHSLESCRTCTLRIKEGKEDVHELGRLAIFLALLRGLSKTYRLVVDPRSDRGQTGYSSGGGSVLDRGGSNISVRS